jgi:hypothetical protein
MAQFISIEEGIREEQRDRTASGEPERRLSSTSGIWISG